MRLGPIPTVAADDIGVQRTFTFVVPMFPFEPVMYTATFRARFREKRKTVPERLLRKVTIFDIITAFP